MSVVEDHKVSFSFEIDVEGSSKGLRRLYMLFFRVLGLFRRMGLPENVDAAIYKLQRFITVMNQARLAALAFQTAAGPVGWGLAIVGLITTGVTLGDAMYEVTNG